MMTSLFDVRIELSGPSTRAFILVLSVCLQRYCRSSFGMEKAIRTILDQAQNNNIRHGEHLKALADFYSKVRMSLVYCPD